MLFILFLAAAAQATFFQPSKSNIQRCFDLTGEQDPNFFDCLQSLVCSAPVPTMSSYNSTAAPSPASSSPSVTPTPCIPCNCSQYDKNSEEYFQCVTNPACDRCTATISWTNTSAPITSGPASSSVDYETMKPGTYTFVANGTTRIMVVPATANATAQIVTVTLTTVLTVPFSESPAVSAQSASLTTTTQSGCPSFCDCSKIKDKTNDEYFQCLTNPNCEHCHVTATTSSATQTSSSDSMKSTNGPDCPDSCDCDRIKDKLSDKYFQCITDDACKHCFRKRWFGRFWARG